MSNIINNVDARIESRLPPVDETLIELPGIIISVALLAIGIFNLLAALNVITGGCNLLSLRASLIMVGISSGAILLFVGSVLWKGNNGYQSSQRKIQNTLISSKKREDYLEKAQKIEVFCNFFPNEIMEKIIEFLPVKELGKVSQMSLSCALFLERVKLQRAKEYGYRGDECNEAKRHLYELFLAISELEKDSAFPKEYFVSSYLDNKLHVDIEASFCNLLQNKSKLQKQLEIALRKSFHQNRAHHTHALLILGADPNAIYQNHPSLYVMAWRGQGKIAKHLIDYRADVNYQDQKGNTALMGAIFNREHALYIYLILHGANLDVQNNLGRSALMSFTSQGHAEMVKFLLSHGANPNIRDNEGGHALLEASNTQVVKLLIEFNADLNIQDNYGDSALICAINKNDIENTEILIKANANLNLRYRNGNTALIVAASNGYRKIVKLLILYKANIHFQNSKGYTALQIARKLGFKDIIKALEKAERNSKN